MSIDVFVDGKIVNYQSPQHEPGHTVLLDQQPLISAVKSGMKDGSATVYIHTKVYAHGVASNIARDIREHLGENIPIAVRGRKNTATIEVG